VPTFTADTLRRIGQTMLMAAGCSEEDAVVVADHLVESNLFGHDSHGALRFYHYCELFRSGELRHGRHPDITRESPSTAVVDGNQSMGQVAAAFAARIAIEKAEANGISLVTLHNTTHIGRVGAYPLMAARKGLMAQVVANAGPAGFEVAPFGGIDGTLASSPLAFAAPRRDAPPILLDMTTSVAAIAKIWVAENKGERLPEGWIIDHEGRPSTDPKDFTREPRGAMLPLGGSAGHKGYGLSMMVELLGGALSGEGCTQGKTKVLGNGVAITCIHVDHFIDRESYFDEAEALVRQVKSSRPAPGHEKVFLPGEIEFANADRKNREGIELDDTTWKKILAEAKELGIDTGDWTSAVREPA
jgi:LDH2 family malate/lactate/ureidoglycolate dehydrogenase